MTQNSQNSQNSKFVIRPRKGPKTKVKSVDDTGDNLANESLMTITQLDMFSSLVEAYKNINSYIFQYELIYYSPLKIDDLILNTVSENQISESSSTNNLESGISSRARGRPKTQKGALKH